MTSFWGVLILKKNQTNPKRRRFGLGGLLLPRRSDDAAALDFSIFDGQNRKKKRGAKNGKKENVVLGWVVFLFPDESTTQLLAAPPLPDAAAQQDFSIFDGQKREKKRGEEQE